MGDAAEQLARAVLDACCEGTDDFFVTTARFDAAVAAVVASGVLAAAQPEPVGDLEPLGATFKAANIPLDDDDYTVGEQVCTTLRNGGYAIVGLGPYLDAHRSAPSPVITSDACPACGHAFHLHYRLGSPASMLCDARNCVCEAPNPFYPPNYALDPDPEVALRQMAGRLVAAYKVAAAREQRSGRNFHNGLGSVRPDNGTRIIHQRLAAEHYANSRMWYRRYLDALEALTAAGPPEVEATDG